MNKKNIFYWTLYDFANSIIAIVFYLYFSQWLVIDKGISDFWYNFLFIIGSLALLATAPIFGSMADRNGKQQTYLNRITLLSVLCFFIVSIITLFFSDEVFLAALFFLIANYLYQFSFVFYNALLHYIAPKEKWGTVSGIGLAGNFLGQVAGIALTIPLASGAIYLIGTAGRAQTFLPATVLFLVLTLPMILLFKLPKREITTAPVKIKDEYRSQWAQVKDLLKNKNIKWFLLAYFFFNDAVLTVTNNFPIYLENVFGASDQMKSILLGGSLFTSIFGALFSGFIIDRIGLKKSIVFIIGVWIVFLPVLGLNPNFQTFMVLCFLMGFLYGAIWTISRAVMTAITPPEKLNFGFSFYTLAERTSTLLGPLCWGLITLALADFGPVRYRVAMVMMAVFVAIGLHFVRKVEIA